ncbi:MAG: hypothetical protein IJB17_00235, partial [Oscillospiraceae bacterium]|nr:hypothetical protein [Oscillospiraceae bacterium]
MKTRRILSVLIVLTMVFAFLTVMPIGVSAATPEPYNGTPVKPIQINSNNYKTLGLTDANWSQWNGYYAIRNASELYGWAAIANVKYGNASAVLLQDIVVNETVSASGANYSWTPICRNYSFAAGYSGTFDGNGHFISGLYYKNTSESFIGFIGNTSKGTIKNLTIKNSYFHGAGSVGSIAGLAYAAEGNINNCRADSSVTVCSVDSAAGGITGTAYCKVSNCVSFASVSGYYCVGGIAGQRSDGIPISNNYYLKGAAKDTSGTAQNGIGFNSQGKTVADIAGECTGLTSANSSHTCVSVTHQQVNATCAYPGLSEYSYCTICGKLTGGTKTETPALGHSWQPATCMAAKTCSRCGVTEGELGSHSFTYSASGSVITESCSNGCDHSETATLEGCEPLSYTGSAITPLAVTYSDGWMGSTGQRVTYSKNINAGTATGSVTIHGVTATQSFTITSADISTAGISGITDMTYTGTAWTVLPTVTWEGQRLTEGTDYTVSGNTATDAGSHTLTVTGKGNFSGWRTAVYTISPADIGTAVVSGMEAMTYTGAQQTHTPTVTWNGMTLQEGTDYFLSGVSGTDAGSYRMIATGDGNFTGNVSADWTIGRLDVSRIAEVGVFDTLTYNRSAQTPSASVTVETEKGIETVGGYWTDVIGVSDTSRFVVDGSGNFTGTLSARSVGMLPLDISGTAVAIEAEAEYDGYIQEPSVTSDGIALDDGDCTVTWDTDPVTVGSYTATITGKGNYTGSVERPFGVIAKPLTIISIKAYSKSYDATADITVYAANLEGFVFYSEGNYKSDVLDYDDVYDDVSVDLDKLVVAIADCVPGCYEEADLSNIVLIGEDAANYTLAASAADVPLVDFYIYAPSVWIYAQDQYLEDGKTLDQTLYTVEGLDEKFTLSGIILADWDDGYVTVDTGNAVITYDGVDVTEHFSFNSVSGVLRKVCQGHSFNDNGFCATGNCQVYQSPKQITVTDEYGSEQLCYEISNAGQLYWFAEQVNEYGNSGINGRLAKDIVVNTDMTAEDLREWTPIGGSYPCYTGQFDGQGHTISGLYFNDENASYVGLFGYTDYNYTIRNVTIANSYFCGNNYVGGLGGYMGSIVSGCTVESSVTVEGVNYVGGLIGSTTYGTVENCYSLAQVSGTQTYVGGLIGYNCSEVKNCYTKEASLIGYNQDNYGGSISNSYYLSEAETEEGGKTFAQFAGGEVAYLLQNGIVGEDIYDEDWNWVGTADPAHIWGQKLGEQEHPVLGGIKVYQVENCKAEAAYSNTNENIGHNYANGSCTVCGEADPAAPALFNVAGVNLALNNDITLYMYLMAENYDPSYTMEITKSYADGREVTKTVAAA